MNKFREKLKEEGRSQRWLSGKIGISETTLSKYVRDKRKPNYKVAEQIAKLLNCKPDDIFFSN
jgi:DNA-binding XRE family transcriptional regulator